MALLTDPTFLVYQMRVSFLRTNDPTAGRIISFNDLEMPSHSLYPSAIEEPGMSRTPSMRRRNTSASEIRHQVALHSTTNPYIVASGHCPEVELAGSPDIRYEGEYFYTRPHARNQYGMGASGTDATMTPGARYPDGSGASVRGKNTNRNAKVVAPAQGGQEEVVGLGVVPRHQDFLAAAACEGENGQSPPASRHSLDMLARKRSSPTLADGTHDPGSLSDSAEPLASESRPLMPIPPRRSLDIVRKFTGSRTNEKSEGRTTARGQSRHSHSHSIATIRLQRPSEWRRKGSSRDAIALGLDFDVTTIFEEGSVTEAQDMLSQIQTSATSSSSHTRDSSTDTSVKGDTNSNSRNNKASDQQHSESKALCNSQHRKSSNSSGLRGRSDGASHGKLRKNPSNMELRVRRGDTQKIPLIQLRDDRTNQTSTLKRSLTMPTRRTGGGSGSGFNAGGGADSRQTRWIGGNLRGLTANGVHAVEERQHRGETAEPLAPGWVEGAPENTWDMDSGSDTERLAFSRRSAASQTWYGIQSSMRPISMFPPLLAGGLNNLHPAPPVMRPMSTLFGAGDSDDDIDLEGDEGSSKTPALLGLGFGRGLRSNAPSPTGSSIRNRADSSGRTALPRSNWAHLAVQKIPTSSALENRPKAKERQQIEEVISQNSRPRGRSDPEGVQSQRESNAPLSSTSLSSSMATEIMTGKGRPVAMVQMPSPSRQYHTSAVFSSSTESSRPGSGLDPLNKSPALAFQDARRQSAAATAATEPPAPPKKSGLAALLANRAELQHNPFSEEFSSVGAPGSGKGIMELELYVFYKETRSAPLKIHVRSGATVEQTIGYALHQYIDESYKPTLDSGVQDVVAWTLRIADDGEIDDDFPALDRSRQISKFALDKFALCLANPEQVRVNESARVRQGKPPHMVRSKSLLQTPQQTQATTDERPSGPNERKFCYAVAPRSERSSVILRPSRIATAATAELFIGTALYSRAAASAAAADGGAASKSEHAAKPTSRLLKIHVLGEPTSAEALRTTTINVGTDLPVGQVFSHVCRKWAFEESSYVLGILDTPGMEILEADMPVAEIPADAELCLYKADGPPPSIASLARARQPPQAQAQGALLNGPLAVNGADPAMPLSTYLTFPVIRRAQMFARHERSLVIYGEFITLMPSDTRTDSTKTLTFHVVNVTCKRNQRSPRKLKLLINRRGNASDKTLDLEAMSPEDATDICAIINRLHQRHLYGAGTGAGTAIAGASLAGGTPM